MRIVKLKTSDYINPTVYPNCQITCLYVEIDNFVEYVDHMINEVMDNSWMSSLDAFDKQAYEAAIQRTLPKLLGEVLVRSTPLNDSIGEYLVSMSAQDALVDSCNHRKLPLAELIKERKSGNGGFDFHTISDSKLVCFGEAKFSLNDTPYTNAIVQIEDFINEEKDIAESHVLKPLLNSDEINNYANGLKGFTAAFYFNAKSLNVILQHALARTSMQTIAQYPEFYLIAIKVC